MKKKHYSSDKNSVGCYSTYYCGPGRPKVQAQTANLRAASHLQRTTDCVGFKR